jgi:phosphoribosylformylglycinamidine (FGAM) synthase-like enzyme
MAVANTMKSGAQDRSSFVRRHAVALSIAAAALAIVVVAGGTAWGVSAAVAGGDPAAPAAMNTAVHAKKGTGAAKQKHSHGTVGTVTTMSDGTWTLQSAAGTPIIVSVGSATTFGTTKKPATESSFAVGDRVGVLGARSGDTVTATRIVHLGTAKHGGTATPTPTPNT